VKRAMAGGDVGFAEAYMDGDWSTPDLTEVLRFFSANFDNIGKLAVGGALACSAPCGALACSAPCGASGGASRPENASPSSTRTIATALPARASPLPPDTIDCFSICSLPVRRFPCTAVERD